MHDFPNDSIDLVVTSPPYWGLRDYGEETVQVWGGDHECEHEWIGETSSFNKQGGEGKQSTNLGTLRDKDQKSDFCVKCEAWRGSLGLEPHPQMFIDHLVEICREIRRVLKPLGTFWLNLGDTYCGSWGNYGARKGKQRLQNVEKFDRRGVTPQDLRVPQSYTEKAGWLQPKQLLGIPWRVAIALQNDSWILRNDIIWYKPNHMPSSVKDRLTNAYEHVFLFVKQRHYYFDLNTIRKPHSPLTLNRLNQNLDSQYKESKSNEYYKNLPMTGGGSRKEIPKILQHMKENLNPKGKNPGDVWRIPTKPFRGAHFAVFPPKLIEPIVKAGCPEGGIVLDPFAGSGTVGRVARKLRRSFVLIDIKPEYCKMAEQRVRGKYRSSLGGEAPLSEFTFPPKVRENAVESS